MYKPTIEIPYIDEGAIPQPLVAALPTRAACEFRWHITQCQGSQGSTGVQPVTIPVCPALLRFAVTQAEVCTSPSDM